MYLSKEPQKIMSMFDEISSYYDVMNNIISLGTHYIVKVLAIRELKIKPRSNILDLCCGTGDFTRIINRLYPRSKVIGVDFSLQMIKLAKLKNKNGVFIKADCTDLPFKENEFDYVTAGFGLRNIENRKIALGEIYRVLKPGGMFLHLDFGYRNIFSRLFDLFVILIAKMFVKNSGNYEYLIKSKNDFPQPMELVKEFESHNFKLVKIRNYMFGIISVQILEKV